jgi:DNA-binding transcriptional LysR family regulator
MNDLAEYMLLPPLMKTLRTRAAGMQVQCYYQGRENLARELASGQLDLAIDVPLISDPNLYHQPLSEESYVCAVRRDHPAVAGTLSLSQYLALDHLNVSSRRVGGGQVEQALTKLGKRRRVVMRVQHSMVAPQIISQTDLAWTAPRSLAERYQLKVLELPFTIAKLGWHLYWHKNADSDQANQWMRETLIDIAVTK